MHFILGLAAVTGLAITSMPAQAASCASGQYAAFFDHGSDEVTPQAAAVLDQVFPTDHGCELASMIISGHTDRDGTMAENMSLSRRMAQNVANYFKARGVSAAIITTKAYGESRPRFATPDGVRDAENRRVEVVFTVRHR